ncbi:MAG: RNA-binding transcriptional accessory protein, partial [Oscillospiraceae bacterium]|nr:RNA-binding transcriptional accessory protein [Oscillospiraceae bacterium]
MDRNTEIIARETGQKLIYVENVVRLLDEGNTVPFIARYRKEMHGTMDDQLIREISDRMTYLRNLDKRRGEISGSIEEQGKMTDELSQAIKDAKTLAELEDVYRPYKQKRRTRATVAKEKGLEPRAEVLFAQNVMEGTTEELAAPFIDPEKEVEDAAAALAGASDIIAEYVSDDADIRRLLKELIHKKGRLVSKANTEEDTVYRNYYDYSEPVSSVPSHRILAINRGEDEKILRAGIEIEEELALNIVRNHSVRHTGSITCDLVRDAADDAYSRLIFPSIEREVRGELTDMASEQAIRMFGLNLKPLLMQPPVRNMVTMGFDPAYRTGCKIAVVDETGKVLDTGVVYPTPPHNKKEEAKRILASMIRKYNVKAIAIGNG